MTDVVVIGGASWNTLVTLAELPEPRSQTVSAVRHVQTLGGTSAGKALHLADLGVEVTIITVVGNDAVAELIVDELRVPGIDAIVARGDAPSERHLNLMTTRGERVSIYLDHAPSASLGVDDAARASRAIEGAAIVAVDLSEIGRTFIPRARKAHASVWVDLHDYDGADAYHAPFLEAANVVLMNGDAMGDPVAFLRSQVDRGVLAGVCTLGKDGAVGVAADGATVRVAALPVHVRDTNGAGDAFMAGMIASVLERGDATRPLGAEALAAAMRRGAEQAVRALGTESLGPSPRQ